MTEPFYRHRDSRSARRRRRLSPLHDTIETRGVIASALALGALTAAATAGGAVTAGAISSHATNKAANLQSASADKALTFQEQQAARDQANFEATQKANYDQWAAREGRLSTLGELAGLAPRQIQAYVPTTGGGSGSAAGPVSRSNGGGNAQQYFQSLVAGKPPTPQTLTSLEPQLQQQGIKVLRNASGVAGKIQLPTGQIVDVIQAAGMGGQNWQWLTGGGAPIGARLGSLGSYLPQSSAPVASAQPLTPALANPYQIAPLDSYLRG